MSAPANAAIDIAGTRAGAAIQARNTPNIVADLPGAEHAHADHCIAAIRHFVVQWLTK
jgi:hypothetical protein